MEFITFLSQSIVPVMVVYIVGFGMLMRVNIFDEFIKGAWDGLKTVGRLAPTLIGLIVSVGVLRTSGLLDFICDKLSDIVKFIGFPIELIPVAVIKMFSASAANGLVFDIFKEYGTDSFLGLAASIMMSCTETVLYCMSVYFMATKVTKTRWTLAGGIISSVAGITASVILAGLMC
ncbi:MAG: nucleoside recognition domain-containing protein [Lachnospiraceae bacterium]